MAVVLWAMDAVGQLHAGAQAAGLKHAAAIVSIGRDLGDEVAVMMNHWLAGHPLAAASYYIVLHGLVTGIAGIVLLRRRHPAFRLHRSVLLAASAMGTIVFWLYPVAPPRMLPGYSDTAATAVPFFSQVLASKAANQFG
ncbi:MAG TPA: phosphatase PAP2 family protein, partial [Streptosporangiaceae bacterium]